MPQTREAMLDWKPGTQHRKKWDISATWWCFSWDWRRASPLRPAHTLGREEDSVDLSFLGGFLRVYSIWGSQNNQRLGKTARKVPLSHPFLRPQMLVRTLICEERPHLLADKAREKRQIDPILPMYGEPWIFGIHHPILRIQQPIVPQVLQANEPSSKDHRSPSVVDAEQGLAW